MEPRTPPSETAELPERLDGLVRNALIGQDAAPGSRDDLRGLVIDFEETDALIRHHGRLRAEVSPEGW